MENLSIVLSIIASVVAIIATVLSIGNSVKIRKIEDHSKNISSGDSSTNTIGDRNDIH